VTKTINIKLIKYFFISVILIGVTPAFYFYTQYNLELNNIALKEEIEAKHQLNYSQKEVTSIANNLATSLKLLSGNKLLLQFIEEQSPKNRSLIEALWTLTATNYAYISQVRFLNTEGMEVARLNNEGEKISFTELKHLQNKSNRDYFTYAKTLSADKVGFFGIDLEKELGKALIPPQPALRLFTPVEINNERRGYLFFNINVYQLVTEIEHSLEKGYGLEFVNMEGYYLASKHKKKTLGHLISERDSYNLILEKPELWQQMKMKGMGSLYSNKCLYSFSKLKLGGEFDGSELYVLLSNQMDAEHSTLNKELMLIIYEAVLVITLITFLSVFIARYIAKYHTTNLESQLALAALNGMSAVVITDKNNRIIKVNEEFTRLSGWKESEVLGKQPSMFQSGKHKQDFYLDMWQAIQVDGIWEGEVTNRKKDGSILTEILRIQAVFNKEKKMEYYIASFVDITARKELENRLRELSEKDPLTKCWNRRKFEEEFSNIVQNGFLFDGFSSACLAIIDIDHFKRVNDEYGHDIGDKVITKVGTLLQTEGREQDFVARIGGEEFAILLPNTELKEAEIIINRLRTSISLSGKVKVTVSGGITDVCISCESSYKRADIALYESKANGRNQISLFSSKDMAQIA